jgi:hypothetical protein
MPSGHLGRPWTGPAIVGGQGAPAGTWRSEPGREPPLAELLDDPIMALLWRSDRLDPNEVRAELRALRLSMRQLRRVGGPPASAAHSPATSGARGLAA